jgi:hypothetical protein
MNVHQRQSLASLRLLGLTLAPIKVILTTLSTDLCASIIGATQSSEKAAEKAVAVHAVASVLPAKSLIASSSFLSYQQRKPLR